MDVPQVAGPSKVRWAFDHNNNDQSIMSDITSSSTEKSSSTLAFANSQLIAHGFIRSPGLQLDALSIREQDVAAKCLLEVLGQRITDATRSDELTVKLRTLTYDHERLKSFHEAAEAKAANAEREAELAKSRMNAASKSLIAEQTAHKQTATTLQRAQSALQYNRATAQNEIKKKEKEVEKYVDRWQKLSNEQARLGSVGSGMACANLAVLEGGDGPKDDSLMEQAMAELEANKSRLLSENDALRDVVLSAARGLQNVVHSSDAVMKDPPPLLTADQLFSAGDGNAASFYDAAAQALNAHHKLRDLMSSVRTKVETLQMRDAEYQQIKDSERSREEWVKERDEMILELRRTKEEAERLAEELGKAGSSKISAALERDTNAAKQVEEAAKRLRDREDELEREREEFSQAALRLGQEREALETELQQLREEKRARRARHSLILAPGSPELRRELDIQKTLTTNDERDDRNSGKVHRVRKSRLSVDPPASMIPIPEVAQAGKGKRKAVAFKGDEATVAKKSRRSATPPLPPDDLTVEYISGEDISLPPAPIVGSSTYPQAESTPLPSHGGRMHTPKKTTNPFEEVLLRSAQRPKPIITNGDTLPTFQPIPRSSSDLAGSANTSRTSSGSSSGESSGSRRGGLRRKSTSPKGRHHAPPTKLVGRDPTMITPPIFTHRRIVGKKHQYAPVISSPLSKYVKAAESSSELSKEELDGAASESFSPTNVMLAAIAVSGGRMNGGLASTVKTTSQRTMQGRSPALDFGLGEDGVDGDGGWMVADDAPVPMQLVEKATAFASPRNDAPLTEEDLMPTPSRAGPIRPDVRRGTSKAGRVPVLRPPKTTQTKIKPVRPALAVKPPSNQIFPPTVKGKEKENVPATKPTAVQVPLPPSPVKKTMPAKTVVAKSSKPSLLKTAKTVPVMTKQMSKITALRDRRKLDGHGQGSAAVRG
ncbi:hypothetical protein FRB95_009979 [Tulasnella sp. JGI-2019a]|nr:hypothetical protein FRB95_009979 [Tulasnella sp. JGI-2019a]